MRSVLAIAKRELGAYFGTPIAYVFLAIFVALTGVFAFFTAYIGLVGLGACVMAATGADLLTAISASLSAVGNVGPAFGSVGPADHYAHLSGVAKATLSFCMVAGRLEIFTFLVVFAPSFWRR